MICLMFIEPINAIVAMGDTYIGRLNGSRRYHLIGRYTWQMIWFSVASSLFFFSLSCWGAEWFIPQGTDLAPASIDYFKTLMLFGPFFPLNLALSSFFIGRNQSSIILKTTILGHAINIVGDFLLIPGALGCPQLGAFGSACSIGAATASQTIILFSQFLKQENHRIFSTHRCTVNFALLWQGLKWGFPNALIILLEYAAWAAIIGFVSQNNHHITVYAITESVYWLFTFGAMGLQKSLASLCSNYIGSQQFTLIDQALMKSFKILSSWVLSLSLPLILGADLLIKLFLREPMQLSNFMLQDIRISFVWLWFYFIFDGLGWLVAGILKASGDAFFVMFSNSCCAWLFCAIPSYLFIKHYNTGPETIWYFGCFYTSINFFILYGRYKNLKQSGLLRPVD